ncbi:MAG: hypothetical protein PHW52_00930, partial [Candidatus Pacebacteria bacterium]|nr:hypothetical protein [Candidatus Paceibacterota bacterium]
MNKITIFKYFLMPVLIFLGFAGQAFAASCGGCPPIVEPACGTASGGTFATAPTANLCVAGCTTSGAYTNNEYWKPGYLDQWKWVCSSPSTQRTVNCYANKPGGRCGSANGQTYSSAPTSGFCASGSFSGLSGTGPWTWTCWNDSKTTGASCKAYKAASPINGQCGSSNGGTFSSAPTTGLCNSGTSSNVSLSGSRWIWSCTGSNGGTTANCSANKPASPINGQCGPSNGGTFSSAPTSGLCNSGTSTSPRLSGSSWIWSCVGSNGGLNANCSANKSASPINGQCGSSNGGTFSSAPTSGLCNSGTSTSPYLSGSRWIWSCTGSNGGSTASCYANKSASPINGQCGSSNGGTFSSAPTSGLCNSGTSTSPYLSGSRWIWSCAGSNGGSTASCYANKAPSPVVNISCGQLIVNGSSQAVTTRGMSLLLVTGNFNWSGNGSVVIAGNSAGTTNTGVDDILKVKNISNGREISFGPFSNAVWTGIAQIQGILSQGNNTLEVYAVDYYGAYIGSNNLYLACINPSINGQCGSSNGGTFVDAPTSGLCNSGTSTSPYLSGSRWIWTCVGSNGGSTSNCYATKGADPVNGQCGSSNGGTFVDAPTSGLCNSGTSTSPYLSGSRWIWTCAGSNGGSTSNCYATKGADPVNGQCGSSNGGTFVDAPT